MVWWGHHRWQIEGFFKTAKHRFGLHRFGQQTLLGLYRWLVLSLTAFILAHWGYLSTNQRVLPDWAEAAAVILKTCLSEVVVALLLREIEQKQTLLQEQGFQVHITRCKI
jgi:hypothetical protein